MKPQEKTQTDLVKSVINQQKDLNAMTVDEVNKTPVAEVETEIKMSKKEMAKLENVPYLEPLRKLVAVGILPEKLKSRHAYDWEYVKGIFENFEVSGEPVTFWYSKYPGDPDCLWEVPCNIPVYVPRMIAQHLEEVMKYHKFDYVETDVKSWKSDQFTHQLRPIATHYRGKFRSIGAFS